MSHLSSSLACFLFFFSKCHADIVQLLKPLSVILQSICHSVTVHSNSRAIYGSVCVCVGWITTWIPGRPSASLSLSLSTCSNYSKNQEGGKRLTLIICFLCLLYLFYFIWSCSQISLFLSTLNSFIVKIRIHTILAPISIYLLFLRVQSTLCLKVCLNMALYIL